MQYKSYRASYFKTKSENNVPEKRKDFSQGINQQWFYLFSTYINSLGKLGEAYEILK